MARLRRDLRPDDAAREARLAEAEAAAVVLRLRTRLLPATTNEVVRARFGRAARTVSRSETFASLAPTQQRDLLLAVFDELGVGERMRAAAAQWADDWRASDLCGVALLEATARY